MPPFYYVLWVITLNKFLEMFFETTFVNENDTYKPFWLLNVYVAETAAFEIATADKVIVGVGRRIT